jgi:predicted transcriptional regulator
VLPVFRSLVAKELIYTFNLTQVEAAEKLRTTQAAISQYINSKRAMKGAELFSDILPKIQIEARETAKHLVKNEVTWDEVTLDFCKFCSTFDKKEENVTGDYYSI